MWHDDDDDDDASVPASSLPDLMAYLSSNPGLRIFKRAYRENMLYKVSRYEDLLIHAQRGVADAMDVIRLKVPELKRAAGLPQANTSDNWHIFDSISGGYQAATDQASRMEAILNRARERLTGSMAFDRVTTDDVAKVHRDALVGALERLYTFSAQAHVIAHVVDIVASFLKDPRLFRTKMMNFMLLGSAGTGKTTLAEAMGDVFAKAGMFVGNNLVIAGRGELVGQYMGETVTKTRQFLVGNLDNGVIFIDEAYAITPWEDGKPESYGTESATAMVEFMTRYPGLYCIITAGYEREMVRYFLSSNEGLDRRFPHKFVLRTLAADEMIVIFQRQLVRAQGLALPNDDVVPRYFSNDAYCYLRALIAVSLQGEISYVDEFDNATRRSYKRVRQFRPTFEYMYRIFAHQAGSMANLADEAITVLYTTLNFADVARCYKKKGRPARPDLPQQGISTMKRIVVQRIRNMALSDSDVFLRQFQQVQHLVV